MPLFVDHRDPEEPVALDEVGHLLPVDEGTHRDRVGDHHLFQARPGAGEDQIPEVDDASQPALVVDHVDVGQVLVLLVELTDPLDRLTCGQAQRQCGDLRGHETARRVVGVLEKSADLLFCGVLEQGEHVLADLVVELVEEVGGSLPGHLRDRRGELLDRHLLDQLGGELGGDLLQDVGDVPGIQLGEEAGGVLFAQLLEDIGCGAGGSLGERLPFLAVELEVVRHLFVIAARRSDQVPGKLARSSESESHR